MPREATAEGFQEEIGKKVIGAKGPRRGRLKKIICIHLIFQSNMRTVPNLCTIQTLQASFPLER